MNTLFKYWLGVISFLLMLFGIYYLFILYATLGGEGEGFRLVNIFNPLGLMSLVLIVVSFLAGIHFMGKEKNKRPN